MPELKTNTFGLIIAYLVPGLILFHGLSFYLCDIKKVFNTFLTSESNIGLFLLVFIFSIGLGLIIQIFRSILFETGLLKKIDKTDLGTTDASVSYFRMIVDEQYRYHQFYGGMVLITPVYFLGLYLTYSSKWWIICIGIIILSLMIYASINSYDRMKSYLTKKK